jgi:ribonuclease P protein subunit RPR2
LNSLQLPSLGERPAVNITSSTMAKPKTGVVPNKSLHSRVSYLYQAAAYLASQQQHSTASTNDAQPREAKDTTMANIELENKSEQNSQAAARHLISDLRAVTLKVQLRMSPAMKHSLCKNCDTMLIDGTTCSNEVENRSKGGKKPWADVLVRKCNTCGSARRFPLAAERQKRRPHRPAREQLGAQDGKGS